MKLTEDQRGAVTEEGNLVLEACPGSGKTRALVAKLLRCVEELGASPRRVACITYTNAAVHEIEERVRIYASEEAEMKVDVTTIHSFCLTNILAPFHWRIPEYRDGFAVAAPDSDVYQQNVDQVADDYLLDPRSAREALESANRKPNGSPIVRPPLTAAAASDFWDALAGDGYIDFTNIVYRSYCLLREFPSVLRGLQAKFAWVLVDEFQDTSRLQVETLRLIAEAAKTKFFLVGDVRQSIFGFAGSEPELMGEFGSEIGARVGPALVENFRSSKPIVDDAERLLQGSAPMQAVGVDAGFAFEPTYVHCESTFLAITDYFLPALDELEIEYGNAAVLAAQWFSLYPLAGRLRDFGVSVVGPGARPYRRRHFFASLAEQLCAQAEMARPGRIRQIERELFFLLSDLTGKREDEVFRFSGRLVIQKLIRHAQAVREEHEGAVDWLERTVQLVSAELSSQGWVDAGHSLELASSVAGMKADMEKNRVDVANLRVADLGLFADPEYSLKLMTLHRSKGREFDAVAIVDLLDGFVPHWTASTADEIDEGRRLLYVGITRARKVLFYFTRPDSRRGPSRFLGPGELEALGRKQ